MKRNQKAAQKKATEAAKAKRAAVRSDGLTQREKFERAAREIEADGSEYDLAGALKKVAKTKRD